MNFEEMKSKAVDEIESQLWKLGQNQDNSIFPEFESDELDYGVQREDDGSIFLETRFVDGNKERIGIKVIVEIERV